MLSSVWLPDLFPQQGGKNSPISERSVTLLFRFYKSCSLKQFQFNVCIVNFSNASPPESPWSPFSICS